MKYLITGGSGFIGVNLINKILKNKNNQVLNIDCLTYASNKFAFKNDSKKRYIFLKKNINDKNSVLKNIIKFQPNIIFHLAAESHVDNSLKNPSNFIKTNILGTFNMLEVAKSYYDFLDTPSKKKFRFIHVSTDEVYGSIHKKNFLFTENSIYKPNSPYSASKASSDHFVRSWNISYGLPTIITNCSNNYGPYQNKEKLIPKIIYNALNNKKIGIYDEGKQVRDWIHVSDHVDALIKISKRGKVGEKYNIGANKRIQNIKLAIKICEILDKLKKPKISYKHLITFIKDRPGHDWKYALNTKKINSEIKWMAKIKFDNGLINTIKWYLSSLSKS